MQKDKPTKFSKNKMQAKNENGKLKEKNKQDKNLPQKKIDEQNSDGSGGAFEEFIDQRNDE